MSIYLSDIRPATGEEWDWFWTKCEYATFFHSREWAEIWSIYTKGKMRPEPLLAIFSDGKKALIPLSVYKRGKGHFKNYISSPGGTYGGWLAIDQFDVTHVMFLTKYLTKKLCNVVWRLNPYDARLGMTRFGAVQEDVTHAFDLSDGFDSVSKRCSRKHRTCVRQALQRGVSIRLASTIDEWRSYYEVYQASLRRWGENASSNYRWDLFQEMFQRSSPSIKLWLAQCDNAIVAGAVCLYSMNHAVCWHAATLAAHYHRRPMNIIVNEVIKDACEKGLLWFDLNPSGGHQGVITFKERLGARKFASNIFIRKSLAHRCFEIGRARRIREFLYSTGAPE